MASNNNMLRPNSRHSQTTSPAVSVAVHDEWDNMLMQQLGGSPGTATVSATSPAGLRRPTNAVLPPTANAQHGPHFPNVNSAQSTPAGFAASSSAPPPSALPGSQRYVKEQMIRAAVSALIQCGVHVSPGMLELRYRTEAELDSLLLQIMNNTVTAGHGPQQPRSCPSLTHIEREIYFDPQLVMGTERDGRFNNNIAATSSGASVSRPHAPVGNISAPVSSAGGYPRTPGGLAHPSPTTVRFNTPSVFAVGSPAVGAGKQHSAASHTVPPPAASAPVYSAAASSPGPVHASASNNNNNNNASSDSKSDSSQTNTVKPRALRAPYDPRLFPPDLYNNVNIQNVRRHVARSTASAFSQHSTQSSQLTAPSNAPRNMSQDAIMFQSSSQ